MKRPDKVKTKVTEGPHPKRSKYKNKKATVDNIVFDSQKEALRYCELKILEKAAQISQLRTQVVFELAPSVVIQGRKRPPLRYVADFVFLDNGTGKYVVEDAKGYRTEGYRIKRHLLKHIHGIDIVEV